MGTYKNIFTTTFDIAVRPKLYFLKTGIKTTKRGKGICSCFFLLHLSVVDNLQEGRETLLPPPVHSCWGQQLWAFTRTDIWAKASLHLSSPLAMRTTLSSSKILQLLFFLVHWLPVSSQLFHLPHTLKPLLTSIGFVIWTKHHESDSNSKGDSTEIKHLHHNSKRIS